MTTPVKIKIEIPTGEKSQKVPPWLIALLGLLFSLRGTKAFLDAETTSGIILLIGAAAWFVLYFIKVKKHSSYFVKIGTKHISAKVPFSGKFNINFDDVDFVKMKVLRIDFVLKNRSVKVLNLANVSANKISAIKNSIANAAGSQGIKIQNSAQSF